MHSIIRKPDLVPMVNKRMSNAKKNDLSNSLAGIFPKKMWGPVLGKIEMRDEYRAQESKQEVDLTDS